MSNFLGELKRRNVFKVATIYVVVSWLLLQVATVVFPVFDIPVWASRLVVVLLALGFPVALIMAWAFDLTPQGIEWQSTEGEHHVHTHVWDWVLGLLLVVVIGLIVASEISHWQEGSIQAAAPVAPMPQPVATAEAPVTRMSIAVLPFENFSSDPENEYFSDGLSEEILNLLAKIRDLKVIGRTSSFAFKGQNVDLRTIGEQLGVSTILEGSVRKADDRVRITAQLINAADGAHIWSEAYDRTLTDVFAVQDDVAGAIIDALEIHVGVRPTRGIPTDNTDAYSLFLRANFAATTYDWQRVEAYLRQAIDLDADFAEAYELLAYAYWRMAGGDLPATDAQVKMGEAAARAVALNPDLVLAKALERIGDPDSYSLLNEIQAFEQAANDRPDDLRILDTLFYNLFKAGYMEEALEVAQRLVDIDPLSPVANGRLPAALFSAGKVDEGFAALDVYDQLDREYQHWFTGEAYLVYDRDEAAIERFVATLEQDDYGDTSWVRELVAAGRDRRTSAEFFDRRIAEIAAAAPTGFPWDLERELAAWYLYFGFVDRYFELIMAYDLDASNWSGVDNLIGTGMPHRKLGFTAHPKFLEVARALGYVDLWEQRGPPDFCSKAGGRWTCE